MNREAGKGSKQRPTNHSKYSESWDRIFGKKNEWDHYSDLPNPDAYRNDYQDIVSTEDCVLDALNDNRKAGD